ncbi:MAG: hypothetical protein DRP42_02100 [Tenericutes bacterium]|nr:MAG: hypothetical protein DRP42_02100 [Mycoplasmatota bacterium]
MNATGVVIETNTDPKRGSLTTVLVTNGTIKRSDNIIIGEYYTKVKAITDENGANLVEAHAGEPVELFGLGESPEVGSRFVVTNNPAEAKAITKTMVEVRKNKNRKVEVVANPNDIFAVLDNKKKQLNYIVKADSFGVLEAITKKIKELSTDDVDVNIISEGIGDFTLADMKLAESSGAKGICFNTKVQSSIRQDVLNKSVEVNEYSIIYKIFDEIEEAAASLKEKVFKETKIGEAKVLQIFEFSKIGTITGSVVTKGKFTNKAIVEVVRNGESIYKGEIESLKIEKDNVKSAANGKEFGLVFKNFHATKVDDQLIAYIIEEVK